MYFKTISLLAMLTLLGSCSKDKHEQHATDTPAPTVSTLQLENNQGEAWELDEHTRLMLRSMAERIRVEQAEPKILGQALQADLDQLIRGCTMDGAAHNELHKYLGMLSPGVEHLSTTGSPEALQNVIRLLDMYPQYFK